MISAPWPTTFNLNSADVETHIISISS